MAERARAVVVLHGSFERKHSTYLGRQIRGESTAARCRASPSLPETKSDLFGKCDCPVPLDGSILSATRRSRYFVCVCVCCWPCLGPGRSLCRHRPEVRRLGFFRKYLQGSKSVGGTTCAEHPCLSPASADVPPQLAKAQQSPPPHTVPSSIATAMQLTTHARSQQRR